MLPRPIEVMCGQDDFRIPLTDVPFPRPKYERWRRKALEAVTGCLLVAPRRDCCRRSYGAIVGVSCAIVTLCPTVS